MLAQAGHRKTRLANVPAGSGESPVIIVKTSEVAMLVYSPLLNAATASAEAVKTAISKSIQPKKRPKNMTHLYCSSHTGE